MDPKFPIKVAILDDYQNVALSVADWSPLENLADVTVFNDHVADIGNLIQRLQPYSLGLSSGCTHRKGHLLKTKRVAIYARVSTDAQIRQPITNYVNCGWWPSARAGRS